MPPRLLLSGSQISTHFRCDNCGIQLDEVSWMQCKHCKEFDLCGRCSAPSYKLPESTFKAHQKMHENIPFDQDYLTQIFVGDAEKQGEETRKNRRQREFERILKDKKIQNDFDLAVVMAKLQDPKFGLSASSIQDNEVTSIVLEYNLKAARRKLHVLSLDGGGVRGYMSIKILAELITEKYLPNDTQSGSDETAHQKLLPKVDKEAFHEGQVKFTKQFDYFVGTSTGGLIAFCLAINYNILDMMDLYSNSTYYFKKNWLGPIISSSYDPSRIHQKIDDIIGWITFPGGKKISAEHATLLDIRNLLNPDHIIDEEKAKTAMHTHGNIMEFVDDPNFKEDSDYYEKVRMGQLHRTSREKILLITGYNTTKNIITIFNTSYAGHWGYRIADVLKSTMAAPTYFPPKRVFKGTQQNGQFTPGNDLELYIDGGVFANDPEVAALWAVRMQWKKPVRYHILSIGTGCYTSQLPPDTWGGYIGWLFKGGAIINTLFDATRSFTEIIGGNLAKFSDMKRMKLNYQMTESKPLDDPNFAQTFNDEWEKYLKHEPDYRALVYFYDRYIAESN